MTIYDFEVWTGFKYAAILGVTTNTLRAWSRPGGRLADAIYRVAGAHSRYDARKVRALLAKSRGAA